MENRLNTLMTGKSTFFLLTGKIFICCTIYFCNVAIKTQCSPPSVQHSCRPSWSYICCITAHSVHKQHPWYCMSPQVSRIYSGLLNVLVVMFLLLNADLNVFGTDTLKIA